MDYGTILKVDKIFLEDLYVRKKSSSDISDRSAFRINYTHIHILTKCLCVCLADSRHTRNNNWSKTWLWIPPQSCKHRHSPQPLILTLQKFHNTGAEGRGWEGGGQWWQGRLIFSEVSLQFQIKIGNYGQVSPGPESLHWNCVKKKAEGWFVANRVVLRRQEHGGSGGNREI